LARFYSNENVALPLVLHLRTLGHDVLTSLDAGNANSAVPDVEVLAFATNQERILLTYNPAALPANSSIWGVAPFRDGALQV